MTRFETISAVAAAALIAVAYSPALAQRGQKTETYIEFDNGTKQVPAEVKGGKGPRGQRPTQPAEPPKPLEPTFTVTGGILSTKEKAKESAVQAAADKLHEYLMQQDPPVTQKPSTNFVRRLLIDQLESVQETDEPVLNGNGKLEKMYRVTVAVKVGPEHIRDLRAHDRSSEALWILAGLGGLAAVVAGFFRIDAWTKGYLTSWLALGTVGAVTLLMGLWWMARELP